MKLRRMSGLVLAAGLVLLPGTVRAQSTATGTIAGVVRDTTGAFLPGVTVEASSPALIEKARTVITDQQGNYKIIDLRPGLYTVAFTLPGFSTVRREGIELTTGFTANVNAELRVGALEETIVVTGASPVVDVQNAGQQTVLSREVLDTLPTAKAFRGFAALTLGASIPLGAGLQDVGGNQGELYAQFIVHGGRGSDQRMTQDGMQVHGLEAGAGGRSFFINEAGVQETTLQTGGMSAESETGGVQVNVVPKDGGNSWRAYFNGAYANGGMQADNVDDALRARGVTGTPSVKHIYDWGGGVGGPIRRDKIWFYTAHRWWGAANNVAGPFAYFNQTQGTPFYTPDTSQPAYTDNFQRDNSLRVTFQPWQQHKFTVSENYQHNCNCFFGVDGSQGIRTPEAATMQRFEPVSVTQATWSYPASSRLLFQAGVSYLHNAQYVARAPGVTAEDIAYIESTTSLQFNSKAQTANGSTDYSTNNNTHLNTQRFAVSYVTGSHAVKVGATAIEAHKYYNGENDLVNNSGLNYVLRSGVPVQLTQFVSPHSYKSGILPNLGIYAQDQWTLRRLTMNVGLRYDYFNAYQDDWTQPATRFTPEMSVPHRGGLPKYTDLSPRLGFAADLFGNGRTAVKGSLGRYLSDITLGVANALNPLNGITSASRTWTDANGNFTPDCNLPSTSANGECGALLPAAFGTFTPVVAYDPALLDGFGARGFNWQSQLSIQHELRPGVALYAGWFRTWYGAFTVTQNQAYTPADFSSFCIPVPTDPALGATSGQSICGFFDLLPGVTPGLQRNVIQPAENLGDQYEHYNGIDVAINARFGAGGLLQGGFSTGQTVTDNCGVVQGHPEVALNVGGTGLSGAGGRETTDFCHLVYPWSGQSQFKLNGIYPLPWDVQVSANYQNLPGIPKAATFLFTSAQLAPYIGHPYFSAASLTTQMMIPYTQFDNRLHQFDLRFTKTLRVGQMRIKGNFDVYNLFNANDVLLHNPRYGPAWLAPSSILGARLFKIGGQFDF